MLAAKNKVDNENENAEEQEVEIKKNYYELILKNYLESQPDAKRTRTEIQGKLLRLKKQK